MQIRCPHCHSAIDLVDEASLADVDCPSCGSHFSLLTGNSTTATRGVDGVRMVSHFRLVRALGVGSFGTVWLAHDTQLDCEVAIKLPRRQDLNAQETEQFFREARAAARLQHPHIARIREAGRDGDTLFIVSDYIDGASLCDWLTGQRLSLREAATLVAKAADALEHAHSRGVIHRDLKPGNILLNTAGDPHLADFGLAKRASGEVTMTTDGQVLGTPAYMPPEQAGGHSHYADARSDIYSLGVILFELLTGELPFRGEREMLLLQIRREEPPRPRKLNARIPRDLETITLKCLEKDPHRRYQQATELAADLRRWLAGEPIVARPIGRLARGWRWCQRNRAVAAMLALVAAVIAGSLLVLTMAYLNAQRQRQIAEQREAGERAIIEFYEDYVLAAARPQGYWGGLGKDATLKEALDHAAPHLDAGFHDQPELEAEVRGTLGMTYFHLADFDAANPHLEQAYVIRRARLGPDHPATLQSQHELAMLRWKQGKFDDAVDLGRQALAGRRRTLGAEHQDTLWTELNLGLFLCQVGRLEESAEVLRAAIEACRRTLGPDHHHTLYGQSDLAVALRELGHEDEAIALDRATLEGRARSLGPEHPDTLRSMGNLSSMLADDGQLDEAEELARRSLEIRRRVLGDDHEETMWSKRYVAKVLQKRAAAGNAASVAESERLYREVLGYCRQVVLPRDSWIIPVLDDFSQLLLDAQRPSDAEAYLHEYLAQIVARYPDRRVAAAGIRSVLGGVLVAEKKFEEAEPLLTTTYAEIAQITGSRSKIHDPARDRVVALYEQWGKPDQAAIWRAKP